MKHYSTMNRSKTTKDRHCAECETQTQDFTQHRQGNPKDRRGLEGAGNWGKDMIAASRDGWHRVTTYGDWVSF